MEPKTSYEKCLRSLLPFNDPHKQQNRSGSTITRMAEVREALAAAIAILQEASAADVAGDSDTALLFFVSAAARLEQLLPSLPREHSAVVRQHLDGIKQRADDIRGDRVRKSSGSDYPAFPVAFHHKSIPLDERRHAVPHATILRPFWLLKTLSKSIQQGAFVTPDLYVCKDVWYQDGATTVVRDVAAKVKFLSLLCEALEPLQQVASLGETKRVVKALDQFLKQGESLRLTLDSELGIRSGRGNGTSGDALAGPQRSSKLEKGVWSLLHKGQTMLKSWKLQHDASYNSYVVWAVNVLEQSQLLDRWTQYFLQSATPSSSLSTAEATRGAQEVLERLHQVSAFFYYTVCRFLLQDMMALLERFLEKSRESVSRFLPVDVKVEDAV